MDNTALPLIKLSEYFAKYPGIGLKTAKRLAYQTLSFDIDEVEMFAKALIEVKETIHFCPVCQTFTDLDLCKICTDAEIGKRNKQQICVVETPKDINAVERTAEYKGVYHVLHGLISPLEKITPEKIKIKELLTRVRDNDIIEVIMATNPTIEGDATALYIAKILKPIGLKVTRLAFGLPIGGILEQADEVTLFKALENRNEL
ncbi:MAG: recombination mediator RecR [Oscillospiraceae bacterium]|jgi:recombination protein RecR|nr:recombination mediator RecR [Oscillospiraceae bacterium]